MPRAARIVVPNLPHHVTQRGCRRLRTFFGPQDFTAYIDLLGAGCRAADVAVIAYCLMPNHVHLILVPPSDDSLARALTVAHQKYAWRINRREGCTGHLWQSRFQSFAMSADHLFAAVRYVELNPVRARLAKHAEAYQWSSAAAHCSGLGDRLVSSKPAPPLDAIQDWRAFLAEADDGAPAALQRRHLETGHPHVDLAALKRLETGHGRPLAARPRGRPRRTIDASAVTAAGRS